MKITRRSFLHTATLGTASVALAAKVTAKPASQPLAKPPRQPNLLLLWADQHRADIVPWAGNTAIKAPRFFAPFGEKSFVFQKAYVTQPVCTPSRGSIMTGLWPHNHGSIKNNAPLRPEFRSIAEYLPSHYTTAYYGKWHLGNENNAQHGFRDWRSIEDLYRNFYTDPKELKRFSDYHNFLLQRGFPPDRINEESAGAAIFSRPLTAALPEPYTKVSFLAGEAEKFLQARRDGQPFILSVNCLEPHPPTHGPLNELHDPATLPTGPAFAVPVSDRESALVRSAADKLKKDGYKNHPIETESDWRRLRANYYGLVSMVDNAYARIMRALEASGQASNTIVVYTSDHGDMCGDHCLMQKGNFYESSTRVPLAIHVPWLSRQRIDFHSPVSLVDLMPTLLDLMGVDVTGNVDGRSRIHALRDPSTWEPGNVCVEWNDPRNKAFDGRSRITHDGWKLNLYHDDQPELYDLNSDPGELRNLAGDPAQSDRVHRLADEIRQWQGETRDTLLLQA